uniref:Uncharacterized protein n=1 Tax=Mola mola TaxID=94237 RepID=A0A3Q3XEC4_MOLML
MLKSGGKLLFQGGLESPKFTAEEGGDKIRKYHATKWKTTKVSGMQFDTANTAGFRSILKYPQGNNHKSFLDISLFVGVFSFYNRGENGVDVPCDTKITISLYMLLEYQDNRPELNDPELWMENRKDFTVYVRPCNGFSSEKMNTPYIEKPYVAMHDSPFKLTNRRNEVWILNTALE